MTNERDTGDKRSVSRRGVLKLGAIATAALGATTVATSLDAPQQVAAHNLPQGEFGSPLYDAAINADGGVKGVFQSPAVEASVPAGKTLNHQLLIQLKNWLNGFQFSYQLKPDDLHTVVATYGSANLLTYNDAMWERYHLGEKYNIIDPATGAPSIRNPFWPSRFDAANTGTPDDPQSFYQDTGIEALQKRGTVFLTWHQTVDHHASLAVADGRTTPGVKVVDVRNDIQANLIPNATLIPSMVGEVSRTQMHGYTLVFVPPFRG